MAVGLRLRRPVPAQVLLLLGLLGALGFGRYHLFLHVREISGLCAAALFFWLVSTTRVRRSGVLPALVPAVVPGLLAVLFAYVFAVRTGYSPLPSVLAQRDFVFFLIAPAIYLLHARGWRPADFGGAFVLAASLTVAYYAASYFTVDAQAWLNSGDPYQESLVVYDESRGYRLKGPLFAVLFLALYCGARALRTTGGALKFGLYLAAATLNAVLLAVNLPRSLLFSAVVALVVYGVFLRRPARVGLLAILFPTLAALAALAARPVGAVFSSRFGQDWSYTARADTSRIAWDYFLQYPVFGFGQDSKQTVPFQELFGHQFFPQDIGLLGVAFKFGLVGTLLYLLLAAWLLAGLLRMAWALDGGEAARQKSFVWALLITCLAIIVAAPLQATFIYGEGVALAAVAWGLVLSQRHESTGARSQQGRGAGRAVARPGLGELRLG